MYMEELSAFITYRNNDNLRLWSSPCAIWKVFRRRAQGNYKAIKYKEIT